jgi:glycogen synthase
MRILFAASEALPYAKTGGLADVIEALPRALVKPLKMPLISRAKRSAAWAC